MRPALCIAKSMAGNRTAAGRRGGTDSWRMARCDITADDVWRQVRGRTRSPTPHLVSAPRLDGLARGLRNCLVIAGRSGQQQSKLSLVDTPSIPAVRLRQVMLFTPDDPPPNYAAPSSQAQGLASQGRPRLCTCEYYPFRQVVCSLSTELSTQRPTPPRPSGHSAVAGQRVDRKRAKPPTPKAWHPCVSYYAPGGSDMHAISVFVRAEATCIHQWPTAPDDDGVVL